MIRRFGTDFLLAGDFSIAVGGQHGGFVWVTASTGQARGRLVTYSGHVIDGVFHRDGRQVFIVGNFVSTWSGDKDGDGHVAFAVMKPVPDPPKPPSGRRTLIPALHHSPYSYIACVSVEITILLIVSVVASVAGCALCTVGCRCCCTCFVRRGKDIYVRTPRTHRRSVAAVDADAVDADPLDPVAPSILPDALDNQENERM
jgi:hypothetical protein